MKPMGMYIHIPFCAKKCEYCDFVSFDQKQDLMEPYFACLIQEIQSVGIQNKKDSEEGRDEIFEIQTIYIGGGTPSFLEENKIAQILETIRENYHLAQNCEITIEVNPGTITGEKLMEYKKAGINRLSIGLQAVQEHVLKVLGRIHTYEMFEQTYQTAREVRFSKYQCGSYDWSSETKFK